MKKEIICRELVKNAKLFDIIEFGKDSKEYKNNWIKRKKNTLLYFNLIADTIAGLDIKITKEQIKNYYNYISKPLINYKELIELNKLQEIFLTEIR